MIPVNHTGARAPAGLALPRVRQSATTKKQHGQFYTVTNPFTTPLFQQWLTQVPAAAKATPWLEPFAGSNNIVRLLADVGHHPQWACYDIQPSAHNVAPQFPIRRRDTLQHCPTGHQLAITNPPYLAKNSATRAGLPFPNSPYDDLYKHSLAVLLEHVGYVAAIIPESFLTSGLFHDRLYGVATLTTRMFEDTDCPVCLAMFVPASAKQGGTDFLYAKGSQHLGSFARLQRRKEALLQTTTEVAWQFNVPGASIGLHALDNHHERSIRFVLGRDLDDDQVKSTGKSLTKIAGLPRDVRAQDVVATANALLDQLRTDTADVVLTAFKGLRVDGDYRRRLDFTLARALLNASVGQVRAQAAAELHVERKPLVRGPQRSTVKCE